mgnify:CR=1 FL=1
MTLTLPQLLTNSAASCFKRCPREWKFRYRQGIRPASDTPPLRIGSAVHDALDMRRKGADREAVVQAIDARYAAQPTRDMDDAVELDIERVIVLALFDGYCKAWPDDLGISRRYDYGTTDMAYLHGLTPVRLIESEKSFELPLRHPDTNRKHPHFKRAGKIDFIAELADGRTAIFETKTTGDSIDPSSDYWSVLAIDPQISGYLLAAQDMGIPAETIVYDVIHKPGMRPLSIPLTDENGVKIVLDQNGERVKNKDGKWKQAADKDAGYVLQTRPETPAEFDVRLRADIAERPEFYFARKEIPRLTNDLADYRAELWQVAAALRDAQTKGRWFRNTGSCRSMRRCEYLTICANGLDPNNPPPGFVVTENLHPELGASV